MKTTDALIVAVYGVFLVISSLYFILAGSAVVDYTGIDRHLPHLATPIIVALISSLLFTGLSSIPLVPLGREGLRKATLMLFLASFAFYSVIILFFMGFR